MNKKLIPLLLVSGILGFVVLGAASNIQQQNAVDASKLPEKIEVNRYFQRWITNLKNKKLEIAADDFNLKEKNEIYNTKWVRIYSLDEPDVKAAFEKNINDHQNIEKIVFSPSGREYLDYRNIEREGFMVNEVHFYGQKEDKLIDARVVDCSVRANCIFDRAYFLDNDTFVVSEISRNIDKKDQATALCDTTQLCTYTFKIHFVDLINNSRYVYESRPFEVVLKEFIPNL
jgi:hypothetical protein